MAIEESLGARTSSGGESVATIEAADKSAEAQQDEALSRILSDDSEPTSTAKGGRARDETGRFSQSDGKKPDTTKPEAKKSEQAPKSGSPEGVNAEDYRKALSALQFDKVPQKYIDSLSPGELVQWGLERAKNHADVERIKSDNAKYKNAKPATSPTNKAEASAESSDSQEQPIDFGKMSEPLAKSMLEDLGLDHSEPLKAFAKQVYESATSASKAETAELRKVIESLTGQFQGQQQEGARAKLTDKYDLADDDRWNKVLEHRNADKNEYASEHEAISVACRLEFADEIIADYESKLKDQHKMRSNGQSTTQHGKTPPKARTQEDVDDQILSNILDGNMEAASRLGRRSNKGAAELMASEV